MLDDSFLLCFNAHHEPIEFTVPPAEFGTGWRTVIYTGTEDAAPPGELNAAAKFAVEAHTAVVLQTAPEGGPRSR